MKPRRRLSLHNWRSANNRHANKYLSHDNYFHFSKCANSTFASVSCRGSVAFQEPWNGLLNKLNGQLNILSKLRPVMSYHISVSTLKESKFWIHRWWKFTNILNVFGDDWEEKRPWGKLTILKEFLVFWILPSKLKIKFWSYNLMDERQLVCYQRSGTCFLRNSVCGSLEPWVGLVGVSTTDWRNTFRIFIYFAKYTEQVLITEKTECWTRT